MLSRSFAQRMVLRYMILWQGLNTSKTMELFPNEEYACVQVGTSSLRWTVKASNHLINMHLLWRHQKQDCWQQLQRKMVAQTWRPIHCKHSSTEKWEKTKRYTSAHPTGGQNLFLMVVFFYFSTSMYGTKQAARRWHIRTSEWMEQNGYPAVNSEKTIFMKRQKPAFIVHGLFVLWQFPRRVLSTHQKDFEITGGGLMETFQGMEVEQLGKVIKLHLDSYMQEVLTEYKEYIKKALCPKRVP